MALESRTTGIPLSNYPTGVFVSPGRVIADNIVQFEVELARALSSNNFWPNEATTVDLKLDISFDGGQSWASVGGFTAHGGIMLEDGVECVYSSYKTSLPSGVGRRVRLSITVTNGPCRTRGFLSLLS